MRSSPEAGSAHWAAQLRTVVRSKVASDAMGSMLLRVSSLGLGLLQNALLARWLAPNGFGHYAYAFTAVTLFIMPLQSGVATLLIREVAACDARSQWGRLNGLLRWANGSVAVLAGIGMALLAAIVLVRKMPADDTWLWLWALMLVPLYSLGALRGAALQGLRRILQGQLPEQILRPAFLVVLLVLVWRLGSNDIKATAEHAMALHVAAMAAAFLVGAVLLLRALPPASRHVAPSYAARSWLKAVLPFTLLAGMQVINSSLGVLMVGHYRPLADVGLYRAGVLFAALLVFSNQAINLVLAPELSRCFASGDLNRAQRLCVWGARMMVLTTLPLALAFVVFGRQLLGLLYGHAYVDAWPVLAIMSVGAIVNASCGANGVLANMSGHERHSVRAVAEALAVNVVVNLALIGPLGATGAAIGAAVSMVCWNLRLSYEAQRSSGVAHTAFSRAVRRTA